MNSLPRHKSVEELTFTDDFMFGTIMKNKPICKGVLERLLQRASNIAPLTVTPSFADAKHRG